MDRDINILFPLQYDWDQEVQHLISFITDWVDTQRLYNSAFGIVDFSADTDVVNPLDSSISGAPLSNNDFGSFVDGLNVAYVSHVLVKLLKFSI